MVVCSSTRNGRDGITVLPLSTSSSARLNEPALASYSIRWAWSAHLALWRGPTGGGARGGADSGGRLPFFPSPPPTTTPSPHAGGGASHRPEPSLRPCRGESGGG